MDKLDEEIAELERKLTELRAKRVNAGWHLPEPFNVVTEDELALGSMPDLVRLILEALPVSVFIKRADKVDGKGRLFTYINQKARAHLKWSADEVRTRYDSEAFLNEWQSELYHNMLAQESDTLSKGEARETQLEWQPGEEFWRRSKTLEVPIFKRHEKEKGPVGFCAIAEEIEFEMFPFIHSWLRKVFTHEYNNMCMGVRSNTNRAIRFLARLKTLGTDTPAGIEVFLKSVDQIVQNLHDANYRLEFYGRTAEELYKAFSPENYSVTEAVGPLMESVRVLFPDDGPFQVAFTVSEDAANLRLGRAPAIRGVVLALIGNAIKHSSSDELTLRTTIRVSVCRQDDRVAWVVANRCQELNGRLELRTFAYRDTADWSARGLTGVIIGEILSRAFPSDVSRMVEFPERTVDGWVKVVLYCDVKGDRTSADK